MDQSQIEDKGKLKEDMCGFDLVLAGDKAILEAADVTDVNDYYQFFDYSKWISPFQPLSPNVHTS